MGSAVPNEILSHQYDKSIVFFKKKHMTLVHVHNRDTVPLSTKT